MLSAPPPITMGQPSLKICHCGDNFFSDILWHDETLWVELKIYGGVIFITILLHFHYFISLETANTQKSEKFLLRVSSRNLQFKFFSISVLDRNF